MNLKTDESAFNVEINYRKMTYLGHFWVRNVKLRETLSPISIKNVTKLAFLIHFKYIYAQIRKYLGMFPTQKSDKNLSFTCLLIEF